MEATAPPVRASCGEIPVLLVGRSADAKALHDLLARSAHPVRRVPTWRAAEQAVAGMRVAILFALPPDLLGCVDRLGDRASGLRVILAVPTADADLEQLVMLRESIRLTVPGPNLEAVHALVHDVLHVTRSPDPAALPART